MRHAVLALVLFSMFIAACEPAPYIKEDRKDYRLLRPEVTHHVDGAQYACVRIDDALIATTQGGTIYFLEAGDGKSQGSVELVKYGEGPSITDLAMGGESLWAVLDGESLVQLDRATAQAQFTVTASHTATQLGTRPRALFTAGGELYLAGDDQLMGLPSERRIDCKGWRPTGVARIRGDLAVAAHGELRADGALIDTAELVLGLEGSAGPAGGWIAVRQANQGSVIRLMSKDGEELSSEIVDGRVERIRVIDGRLYVITPSAVSSWRLDPQGFNYPESFTIKGALDLCSAVEGDLFICGTFGRSHYHPYTDSRGRGDTFFSVTRAPGRLESATSDGRRVLAGSAEGVWMYKSGDDTAEITTRTLPRDATRTTTASCSWGEAQLDRLDGHDAVIVKRKDRADEIFSYPQIAEIESEGDALWIGHSIGIDVIQPGINGNLTRVATIRLQGPVIHLFLENTGGIAFVTLFGGMGVIDWIPYGEPMYPIGHPNNTTDK
ncbi:MAG: hypothetical protein O2800_04255 [Planctomycetota bacterium]|nr:hypothetical protein [Planctomycetota bacterium]